MEKNEYKIKHERILKLIASRKYEAAQDIADTIDWNKVKSSTTLCEIGDLYAISRRYQESMILFKLADKRCPNSKKIIYSLCELSIKMDDVIQANNYYNLFCKIAPTESQRDILLYKIYAAQEINLDERIKVLERLKKKDFMEKWGYELAKLYSRVGRIEECVELCDEIIMWFGGGKFSKKVMELKMLHSQLTCSQQELYDSLLTPEERESFDRARQHIEEKQKEIESNRQERQPESEKEEIYVKTMDVGQYSTINMQEALARSMQNLIDNNETDVDEEAIEELQNTISTAPKYNTSDLDEQDVEYQDDIDQQYQEYGQEYQAVPNQQYQEYGQEYQAVPNQQYQEYGQEYQAVPNQQYQEYGQEYQAVPNQQYQEYNQNNNNNSNTSPNNNLEYTGQYYHSEELENLRKQVFSEGYYEGYYYGSQEAKDGFARTLQEGDIPSGMNMITPEAEVQEIEGEYPEQIYQEEGEPGEIKEISQPEENEPQDYSNDYTMVMPIVENNTPKTIYQNEMENENKNKEVKTEETDYFGKTREIEKITTNEVTQDTITYNVKRTSNVKETDFDNIKNRDLSGITKDNLIEMINSSVNSALQEAMNSGRFEQKPEQKQPEINIRNTPITDESELLEKQITGQMCISDYLDNWENVKKNNEIEANDNDEKLKQIKKYSGEILNEFEKKAIELIVNGDYEEELTEENVKNISESIEREEDNKAEDEKIINESQESEAVDIAEADSNPQEAFDGEEAFGEEVVALEKNEEIDELEYTTEEEQELQEEIVGESGEEQDLKENTEDASTAVSEFSDSGIVEEEIMENEPGEAAEETEDDLKEEITEETEDDLREEITEENPEKTESYNRELTEEEKELFGNYIYTNAGKIELLKQIDKISLASHTGNVFVTGGGDEDINDLAQNLMKYIKAMDNNFTGRIGKLSGSSLNEKNPVAMMSKLSSGGLIVEQAGGIKQEILDEMIKYLNKDNQGILVIFVDNEKTRKRMLRQNDELKKLFNVHISIEELSDNILVKYGRKYAESHEYSIDEMGMLALHTKISNMQTADHHVTVEDVKDIIEKAIHRANRKTLQHLIDILLGRRYDDQDMIIIKEKDFDF